MATDWHEQFKRWAKPPSETEEQKGSNAAEMVRKAIREDPKLSRYRVDVYATGSYRNSTNVRLDSDIDIAVVLHDSIRTTLPEGLTLAMVGLGPATYLFPEFREDVGVALRRKFGDASIQAGNKTYNAHENSYRLDADITPFLEHRRYTGNKKADGTYEYSEGVELLPRNAPDTRVQNWHQQHYDAGVAKNDRTARRYKRIVRILKNLCSAMAENGTADAKAAAAHAPSFLIECLVFNAPNGKFHLDEGSYYKDVRAVLAWLWNNTKPESDDKQFVEVSGLKWLFQSGQPWTKAQSNAFSLAAWLYVGFLNE